MVEFRQEVSSSSSVKIYIDNIQTGARRTLELEPPTSRGEILVEIKNMPENEICQALPYVFPIGYTNHHFVHLSRMLPLGPSALPTEVAGFCPAPGSQSLPEPLCSCTGEAAGSNAVFAAAGSPQCPGGDMAGP
jgi:hypothetical protein